MNLELEKASIFYFLKVYISADTLLLFILYFILLYSILY